MTEPFGRRRFVLPTPPAVVAPPPRVEPSPAPRPPWKPEADPELEAWKASRASGLWLRLVTPWVLVLGGPMSFLLPEGMAQLLGAGATLIGGYGLWRRFKNRSIA